MSYCKKVIEVCVCVCVCVFVYVCVCTSLNDLLSTKGGGGGCKHRMLTVCYAVGIFNYSSRHHHQAISVVVRRENAGVSGTNAWRDTRPQAPNLWT